MWHFQIQDDCISIVQLLKPIKSSTLISKSIFFIVLIFLQIIININVENIKSSD